VASDDPAQSQDATILQPGPLETDPDDQGLYHALGLIAARWSGVELQSGVMLAVATGNDNAQVGRIMVSGQPIHVVWDLTAAILKLYREDASAVLGEFESWRKLADRLRIRRNDAIHSGWLLVEDGPTAWDMFSRKAREDIRLNLFPAGVAELRQLAVDIASCRGALNRVHVGVANLVSLRRTGK
jgi:hypothetical protein